MYFCRDLESFHSIAKPYIKIKTQNIGTAVPFPMHTHAGYSCQQTWKRSTKQPAVKYLKQSPGPDFHHQHQHVQMGKLKGGEFGKTQVLIDLSDRPKVCRTSPQQTSMSNVLLQKGSEEDLSVHRVTQPRLVLSFMEIKNKNNKT